MPVDFPITTKRLKATWSDGSAHDVLIEIGRPYPEGNSFRCQVRASGLQQDYSPPDLAGADEMQALTLSLSFVRFLLEWHLEAGGRLFYPAPDDHMPYTPHDLPTTDDNDAA